MEPGRAGQAEKRRRPDRILRPGALRRRGRTCDDPPKFTTVQGMQRSFIHVRKKRGGEPPGFIPAAAGGINPDARSCLK